MHCVSLRPLLRTRPATVALRAGVRGGTLRSQGGGSASRYWSDAERAAAARSVCYIPDPSPGPFAPGEIRCGDWKIPLQISWEMCKPFDPASGPFTEPTQCVFGSENPSIGNQEPWSDTDVWMGPTVGETRQQRNRAILRRTNYSSRGARFYVGRASGLIEWNLVSVPVPQTVDNSDSPLNYLTSR